VRTAIAAENAKNAALQARDAAAAEYYDALHEKNEAQQLFDSAYRLIVRAGRSRSCSLSRCLTRLLPSRSKPLVRW
jgi:hypothetical protein